LAKKLSVPYPETIKVDKTTNISNLAEKLSYPVVIKPSKSKVNFNDKVISLSVTYANNFKELKNILKTFLKYEINILIQKKIEGEGIGHFSLWQNGVEKVNFYHKRILEKPPSGGVSVLCQSVNKDLKVKDYATKILSELKWHGVAMVEFKKEYKTGIPYLMEINARFWGSLELSIKSGLDFPFETYNMICGKELKQTINNYIIGIRCAWISGLLDHFYLLLKNKNNREIFDSLKKILINRHKTYDFVFEKNDRRPFTHEMCQNIKNAF
jgi:predicted ATP-grasp superfamily ATP-dependent carboligase